MSGEGDSGGGPAMHTGNMPIASGYGTEPQQKVRFRVEVAVRCGMLFECLPQRTEPFEVGEIVELTRRQAELVRNHLGAQALTEVG